MDALHGVLHEVRGLVQALQGRTPPSLGKRLREDDDEGRFEALPSSSSSSSSSYSSSLSAAHHPAGGAGALPAAAGARPSLYVTAAAVPFAIEAATELKDLIEDLVVKKKERLRDTVGMGASALREMLVRRYKMSKGDYFSDARDALAYIVNETDALTADDEAFLLKDPPPAPQQQHGTGGTRGQASASASAADVAYSVWVEHTQRRQRILNNIPLRIKDALIKKRDKTFPKEVAENMRPYAWKYTVTALTEKLKEWDKDNYPYKWEPQRGGGGGVVGMVQEVGRAVGNFGKDIRNFVVKK